MARPVDPRTREKLLDAVKRLSLKRGFGGTTVDAICEKAQVSKGSFFHYFGTKDEAADAALERFAGALREAFATAPFWKLEDPQQRLAGYVEFAADVCRSSVLRDGCLVGALAMELSDAAPGVRKKCAAIFDGWARSLKELLDEAFALQRPKADTQALARLFVVTLEGALLIARAFRDPTVVDQSLQHYARYLQLQLEAKKGDRR
jgi:TetR/AcrR family transcriptional regulator, transcriptional repressor for nem operon